MKKTGTLKSIDDNGYCILTIDGVEYGFDFIKSWKSESDFVENDLVDVILKNDLIVSVLSRSPIEEVVYEDSLLKKITKIILPNEYSVGYLMALFSFVFFISFTPSLSAEFNGEYFSVSFLKVITFVLGNDKFMSDNISVSLLVLIISFVVLFSFYNLFVTSNMKTKPMLTFFLSFIPLILLIAFSYFFYTIVVSNNYQCLSVNIESLLTSTFTNQADLLYDGLYNNGEIVYGFWGALGCSILSIAIATTNYFKN